MSLKRAWARFWDRLDERERHVRHQNAFADWQNGLAVEGLQHWRIRYFELEQEMEAEVQQARADLAAAQARGAVIEARARAVVEHFADFLGEEPLLAALAEALEGGTP